MKMIGTIKLLFHLFYKILTDFLLLVSFKIFEYLARGLTTKRSSNEDDFNPLIMEYMVLVRETPHPRNNMISYVTNRNKKYAVLQSLFNFVRLVI